MRSLNAWLGNRRPLVGFLIGVLGVSLGFAALNANTHSVRRTADKAEQLAKQNKTLIVALGHERNERIQGACEVANGLARAAPVSEYQRMTALLNQLIPEPRTQRQQEAVNAAIAADVMAVRTANPQRDCSARALGLKPIPDPQPSSASQSVTRTTVPVSSPPTASHASPPKPSPKVARPTSTTTACQCGKAAASSHCRRCKK